MSQEKTNPSSPASENILDTTQEHFLRALAALNEMIRGIENGNTAKLSEAQRISSDVRKAMQSAMDERTRVENLRKADAGIVNDYALDFAKARAEVERRLACLRAVCDSGKISE